MPSPQERLESERLLFRQLLAMPRKRITLSYSAIDPKGQPLLPSSFLHAVKQLFEPAVLKIYQQRMLLDRYFERTPLCDREYRTRIAIEMREAALHQGIRDPWYSYGIANELIDHLWNVKKIATCRTPQEPFSAYDGFLESPQIQEDLSNRFGSGRTLSPTSLETYITCPFRFMLEHVLHLRQLEEPGEKIEQTRIGATVHRALTRFHQLVQKSHPTLLDLQFDALIEQKWCVEIDIAVREYQIRDSSPAGKKIWELEGDRLKRFAKHYREVWENYLKVWKTQDVRPIPTHFEIGFGSKKKSEGEPLRITIGDITVQIGGRIDRIDVADLADGKKGFWIIDYKTGSSSNYTQREIQTLKKLQLPLYAMAMETTLSRGEVARPLGLIYWLILDDGVKTVLPGNGKQIAIWLQNPKQWEEFRGRLGSWIIELVKHIRLGQFPLAPSEVTCTQYCPMRQVCRINQGRAKASNWDLAPPVNESAESSEVVD